MSYRWFRVMSVVKAVYVKRGYMIIRHSLPTTRFTRIDRWVFTNTNLTDGATRLYGYLCGLRNGANFSDKYIMQALMISQAVLTKRKKELKDNGLILVDQITPRIYVIYIGHSRLSASEVKAGWDRDADIGKGSKV